MNISEIRKTYPQYNDLSDIQLADKFHSKYYSDIPKDTFYAKMGIKQKSLWERGVEATGAESDMMSSPANAEILRTAVGGGAAWIPAGIIKAAGIVSGQREGADELANVIQEKITGTPQTPEGKLAAQQISAPFEKLSEKSQEYADIVYDKTGSPLLATATRVAGEALPFAVPYAAGKGLKAVKGAVKAPEIDLGKVSEKPYSITPDVSAELKSLKGETPKAEVKETVKEAPKVAEDPLIAEARKYKTAEEFVNSRPIFEHETNAEFDKFDLSKAGSGQGEAWLGKGIYLQEKGSFKLEKYGNKKIESGLTPEANIFEIKDTPNGKYRDNFVEYAVNNNIGSARALAEQRIKDGLSLDNLLPRDILRNNPNAVEQLKKAGFDGLLEDGELVVYNPDVLKTKSQLTSIWNKAQEGKVETPKAEMPVEGKPAKAAVDINKDLVEKGFEGLPERELARYNTIQKAEEVGKAQALVGNPDFFEMAKGNKPLPPDVHPQVLFNVAINEATKAGNIDMLMDLAKSPIAEQRSLAAQQLGASAWEKPVNNIVKTINEVKKVRESKIKNPKVKEVVKTKLREEVSKINLSKEELNWEKFLSKIEC